MKDTFDEALLIIMPLVLGAIIESLDPQTAKRALRALERRAQSSIDAARGPELDNATSDLYHEFLQKLEEASQAARS